MMNVRGSDLPVSRLLAPAAVVLLALVILVAGNYLVGRNTQRQADRRVELTRNVGEIRFYDEALTQSARLAVITGDPAERRRYDRLAVEFDEVVASTLRQADDAAVAAAIERTGPSTEVLLGLEERALALAEQGRREEAAAILSSREYGRQKRAYATALARVIDAISAVRDRNERRSARYELAALLVGLVGIVIALLALQSVLKILSRWSADRRLAEDRLQSILGSAGEGIYGLDREGRAVFVNEAAASMTGHDQAEILGRSTHDLVHHHHADGRPYPVSECPVHATLQEGTTRRVADEVYWRKDGTSFPVEYSATPIEEDGTVTGAVVIFRDVSERREIDRMKDEFTSVVSHELRTPLTSIRGSLGLLASGALGPLPERGQRMVDIAVQNTDRLVRLINDILDIERIESGEVSMDVRPTDAAGLVQQAAEVMQGLAERAGVRLEAAAEPAALVADPDRIVQTLTNLLSNAIKFSPQGGLVTVRARRVGADVLFEVRDTGRGIPADKLGAVFERFQQVDASDAREKGGTGLGLPICRSIVQQHGGRIWAESVEGRGSTFSFTLPGDDRVSPADAPDEGSGPLVLVCEDDASIRAVLGETLRVNGYRAVLAAGGEEAVELAIKQRPDAVLLDLLMPGMDGWQTARALKDVPSLRGVPIVVVSVVDRLAGERAGPDASDWVAKPIDEQALLRAVERATGQADRPARVLVVEDDRDLANVLRAGLERDGITVAHAATGDTAVDLGRDFDPDLLILDLGMPALDGFEILDLVREDEMLRGLPIVVYTARDIVGRDLERLRAQGVTEVLTKARVSPQELERRVLGLLRPFVGRPEDADDQADPARR